MTRSPAPYILLVTLLLTGLSFTSSQEDLQMKAVNLCEGIDPNHKPNTIHLAHPDVSIVAFTNWTNNPPTRANHCLMRFTTCANCRLRVKPDSSFYYDSCLSVISGYRYDGWCVRGCTYVHLYDRDYSSEKRTSFTNSLNRGFVTESSVLYVVACSNQTSDEHVVFELKITAEDKTQYFEGTPWDTGNPYSFSSPFFPKQYVLNSETYMYVFQAARQDDFITISFDDWQLSQFSSILFDSANIRGKIWGSNSRPWIISDSHSLQMTFETGPYRTWHSPIGFKATYTFHNEDRNDVPYVHTDCGSWIDREESGQITFNPRRNGQEYYDCIWVIKPHPSFQWVMISVVNYSTQDSTYRRNQPSRLEVREGVTSLGRSVISTVPSLGSEGKQTFLDHYHQVGFYVRLKGHYWGRKDVVLTFTSFNLEECSRDLFPCTNGHCIPLGLQCNGIDNCGDYSDESDDTCGNSSEPSNAPHKNILSPVVIIPIVVAMFTIVIVCLLVLFIRRCRRLSSQARRAQRQQGRISTVSGTVSRQQRRHDRRREGRRGVSGGDHYHLHHDPPPSYEDVLSATPIGYLNLGFSDATSSSNGLIQPPSYDEAISPTAQAPTLVFSPGGPQDESSDSSLPETAQHSLSTSYSSDDTQRAGAGQRRHRAAALSSSSDSSNEGEEPEGDTTHRQRRGRRGNTGPRERDDNRQTENERSGAHRGVVKPEEGQIPPPVCPSTEIAHNKTVKPHNKPDDGQRNEDHAVITECSASADLETSTARPQGEVHSSAPCQLETSPMISAPCPPSASSREESSALAGYQGGGRGEASAAPIAACSPSPAHSPQDSQPRYPTREGPPMAHHQHDPSSPSREPQGRPSPSRRVPSHVLKARNPPSHKLMKHLSRSMNDLDRRPSEDGHDHERGSMPSRQLSLSMHNMLEVHDDRGGEHRHSQPNRYHHHQGQILPDGLNGGAESDGRSGSFPPGSQARRARSEDFQERSRTRPERPSSLGHPDGQHRNHSRPETLPAERPMTHRGEGFSPSSTRPRPQPKPRRLQQAGGRAAPEPRQRQFVEGYRYPGQLTSPSTYASPVDRSIPSSDRNRPPDRHRPGWQRRNDHHSVDSPNSPRAYDRRVRSLDRGQQFEGGNPPDGRNGSRHNTFGYQDREDAWQTNRPLAAPRPERGSSSSAGRGQTTPGGDVTGGNNRQRYQFGQEFSPGPPHSHTANPPYQHADPPPPYRPRNPDRPSRPASHGATGPPLNHTNQVTSPSEHRSPTNLPRPPPPPAPRPNPIASNETPSPSAGSFPRMGMQSASRLGQPTQSANSCDPSHGSDRGGSQAPEARGAPTPLHGSSRLDAVEMASPATVGVGAVPFVSLQLGGRDENEEEDIYV